MSAITATAETAKDVQLVPRDRRARKAPAQWRQAAQAACEVRPRCGCRIVHAQVVEQDACRRESRRSGRGGGQTQTLQFEPGTADAK